jgi:hypothetical protein
MIARNTTPLPPSQYDAGSNHNYNLGPGTSQHFKGEVGFDIFH